MIINCDRAESMTQSNWDDALLDAHCPTCLALVVWSSPHLKIDSGTSPRVAEALFGECCGVSYTLTSVDQPASDHTQLFGIIKRVE